DRVALFEKEKEKGKGNKGYDAFGLGELVGLFRETGLMKKWAEISNRDIGLIESFNYNSVVELRNNIIHNGGECGKLEAELVFNYVKSLYATLGVISTEGVVDKSYDAKGTEGRTDDKKEMVNIALVKEKGIIVNQADNSRNMSCKVETMNRMLSVAYINTRELAGEEAAEKMLYDMGYDSGSAFGRVMYERYEVDNNELSFEEKLAQWCEFDSVVGWGKFKSSITVNEEEGTLEGYLEIKDSFPCHNRKRTDVPICGFMRGYCEGVITQLLGDLKVHIGCEEGQCPLKNALKKVCRFYVRVLP
ncbi:MAG: hypothetical protein IJX95_10975, partial [Lachnospiraceae bacterium]|nr:hypothetical protein [Lachnospiraceae bacterium]